MSTVIPTFSSSEPDIWDVANDRVGIGHVLVDNCSFEEAASSIISHILAGGPPAYVITPNAQHVVLLDKEMRLREIYHSADLVIPDGISLVLAARMFGRQLKERVAGVDLFQRLCALAAQHQLRVFLLGGKPGSAELASDELRLRYPSLQISSYCPPLGFEQDQLEAERTAEAVRAAKPDLLFVAFGAPKQEYWIFEHGRKLGATVCVGVGGSFEMVGGIIRRAPLWVQRIGCEWLYRLSREPRRMWRRYLIGNTRFCMIVLQQRIRRAIFEALVSVIKSTSFQAELQDAKVRADALDIALRVTHATPRSSTLHQ